MKDDQLANISHWIIKLLADSSSCLYKKHQLANILPFAEAGPQ